MQISLPVASSSLLLEEQRLQENKIEKKREITNCCNRSVQI